MRSIPKISRAKRVGALASKGFLARICRRGSRVGRFGAKVIKRIEHQLEMTAEDQRRPVKIKCTDDLILK